MSHLQEGDRAGICILQDPYASIYVEVKDGQRQIVWQQDQLTQNSNFTPATKTASVAVDSIVYLRAAVSYSTSKTDFYYSLDNQTFTKLGQQTSLGFNLSVFVGARFGLFCYATNEAVGDGSPVASGYADFDWFSTEDSFDEATYYPADFEGFNEDMLTLEKIALEGSDFEVMVGNNAPLTITATYRDGHTANVAAQARYTVDEEGIIEIRDGRIRGLSEGTAHVHVSYTDPLGNEQTASFAVRSTFFPFGAEYINTSLFGQGKYTESTHTFRPGQWGQMGWEYPNGADMSAYKYLVIKLKATSSQSHLNIFTEGSIWSSCCATADFGSKKQIVVNLQTAKYTDGDKKGQKLDTKNIRIVCFWGTGGQDIKVDDIYLTNNDDYTPNSIELVTSYPSPLTPYLYDLQGRRIDNSQSSILHSSLKKGIYIKNGKKIIKK